MLHLKKSCLISARENTTRSGQETLKRAIATQHQVRCEERNKTTQEDFIDNTVLATSRSFLQFLITVLITFPFSLLVAKACFQNLVTSLLDWTL